MARNTHPFCVILCGLCASVLQKLVVVLDSIGQKNGGQKDFRRIFLPSIFCLPFPALRVHGILCELLGNISSVPIREIRGIRGLSSSGAWSWRSSPWITRMVTFSCLPW